MSELIEVVIGENELYPVYEIEDVEPWNKEWVIKIPKEKIEWVDNMWRYYYKVQDYLRELRESKEKQS